MKHSYSQLHSLSLMKKVFVEQETKFDHRHIFLVPSSALLVYAVAAVELGRGIKKAACYYRRQGNITNYKPLQKSFHALKKFADFVSF